MPLFERRSVRLKGAHCSIEVRLETGRPIRILQNAKGKLRNPRQAFVLANAHAARPNRHR